MKSSLVVALVPSPLSRVSTLAFTQRHIDIALSDRFADPSKRHQTRSRNGTRHVGYDGAIGFSLHISVLKKTSEILDF